MSPRHMIGSRTHLLRPLAIIAGPVVVIAATVAANRLGVPANDLAKVLVAAAALAGVAVGRASGSRWGSQVTKRSDTESAGGFDDDPGD